MFEVQSIHLLAALWMGMSLSQIKKIPSFWEWHPPPLGINEVPGVFFFHLLLCVGKFLFCFVLFCFVFSPEQDKYFFFSSHVGQVFFYILCVGQVFFFFFFFFYLWVGQVFLFFVFVFFLPKLPAPPLKSNGASLIMDYPPTSSLSMLLLLFHNLSSLIASSTMVCGKKKLHPERGCVGRLGQQHEPISWLHVASPLYKWNIDP